eukprot:scaffold98764_cov68-Phaeocystis_antarctica.AAC.5
MESNWRPVRLRASVAESARMDAGSRVVLTVLLGRGWRARTTRSVRAPVGWLRAPYRTFRERLRPGRPLGPASCERGKTRRVGNSHGGAGGAQQGEPRMLAAPGPSSTRAAAADWYAAQLNGHAANATPASQVTSLPTESPLALAVAQEGSQPQLPRFAACVGAPGGWLRVRLVRCTNASPIAHEGQVSQVVAAQCVCAVASQPGSTARSAVVRGDSSGGAEWDETLWLPLPLGSIALYLELRLSVHDAAQRSQCAPMALLPRTGKATLPLRGASGSCWCAVRGSGPPRSDGEPAGSAELLLEYWRLQPEAAEEVAEAEPGAAGGLRGFWSLAAANTSYAAEAVPGSSEGGGAEPGGPVPVGEPKAPTEVVVGTRGAAECGGGKPRPVVLLDDLTLTLSLSLTPTLTLSLSLTLTLTLTLTPTLSLTPTLTLTLTPTLTLTRCCSTIEASNYPASS